MLYLAGMNIGEKLKNLRGNMSQAELSRRSGVDKAILSKIENGKMPGTVDCHKKLASCFGLKLSEFYAYLEETKIEPAKFHPSNKKTDVYQNFLEILTDIPLSKRMLPTFITLNAGEEKQLVETLKEVERFIIITEGKIKIRIEEKVYTLEKKQGQEKGDSLYSTSPKEHNIKNVGDKKACAICISCPPVL